MGRRGSAVPTMGALSRADQFEAQFAHSLRTVKARPERPIQEKVDEYVKEKAGNVWYREYRASCLGRTAAGQVMARRVWGDAENPGAHGKAFRELDTVQVHAHGFTWTYRNGAVEQIRPDDIVVVRLGMYPDHGLILTDGDGAEAGYLVPWEGEEAAADPTWDVYVSDGIKAIDRQLANGVSLFEGRRLIQKATL